jgi:hypothetical protein
MFNMKNRLDLNVTQTRQTRWVNAAYTHMCLPAVHRFREMQYTFDLTLATGDNDYAIDETTLGVKVVAVRSAHHILATAVTATAEKRRLSPRNIRWFDRRTLTTGTPTVYAIDGETFYLHPVPTSDENGQFIRVRSWREPALLSGNTDTTVLPSYYDEVLLIGAQWMAERSLGYREAAELTKQDYVALLNEGHETEELEAEDWDFQVDVNPHAQGMSM